MRAGVRADSHVKLKPRKGGDLSRKEKRVHGKGGPTLFESSPLLVRTAARAPHTTGHVPRLRGARSTRLLRAPPRAASRLFGTRPRPSRDISAAASNGVTGERPRPAPGLSATGTAAGGAWARPAHSPCGEAGCSFGGRGGPGSGERKSGPHHTFTWTSRFTIWGPSYLQKEIWLNYSPYLTQWFRRL